jgi:phosphate transport system substrate-binding protein
VYNIPGVRTELKFTGQVLADIFLGRITTWNHAAIAKLNPDVTLPSTEITVVHRAEGSGTTYIFADYLAKVSPDWKKRVGISTSLNWPVGVGGKGNEGVAGLVQQTPGAIGYVELIYALQNKISYGTVQNLAGEFVKASEAAVTAAAAAAAKQMPADFRVSITNPPGKTAYPIASFTWLLVPSAIEDGAKRKVIVGFLRWMLADGQKEAEPLAYARLPKEVVTLELKAISGIK